MKFLTLVTLFAASAMAAKNTGTGCGFPNGADCKSLGTGADGNEQFADDGCCLLPLRCGNGDGGNVCDRVTAGVTQDPRAAALKASQVSGFGSFARRRGVVVEEN
ncbi:hypothetical protein B0J14DRAFT_661526 [Halenospora varia]|nr:hypothetical protein B0J14DRAFT_661526 [Halenospora varia]